MFKKYKNQKYASIAYYAFIVIVLSVALIFTLINIQNIWNYLGSLLSAVTAFVYGFAIAYICNPIYKRLHAYVFAFVEKKKARPKLRKTFALIFTYVIFFGVIAIIVFALIPSIGNNIESLTTNIGQYLDDLQESINKLLTTLSINIPLFDADEVLEMIKGIFYDENGKLIIMDYLGPTASAIINIGANIVSHVVYFIIGLILSVYFLMYKHSMTAKCRKLFCAIFPKKTYQKITEFAVYTDRTFGRYLMGAALDSLLVGAIVVVVLSILGYKFAAIIGVIVGITNIIPFFGPFLGAVPSAFLILLADGPIRMLIFVAIILVLQQIDGNIINPHIVGATTGLTPIGVIAAVTICSHIFGFIGMIIGVPLCAVLTYIVSMLLDKRLKSKNLPSNSELFKNKDIFSNEAFIEAALEVEAMNIIEKEKEAEILRQQEEEHNQAISVKQDELIYVRTHPNEYAETDSHTATDESAVSLEQTGEVPTVGTTDKKPKKTTKSKKTGTSAKSTKSSRTGKNAKTVKKAPVSPPDVSDFDANSGSDNEYLAD